jgi:hypothetical protein
MHKKNSQKALLGVEYWNLLNSMLIYSLQEKELNDTQEKKEE